jgi:hypothetical protein
MEMSRSGLFLCLTTASVLAANAFSQSFLSQYKGLPYDSADPVAWRQWHHWNLASNFLKVRLSKGRNVLTVHILTGGNMNLSYFNFKQDHWRKDVSCAGENIFGVTL